MGSVAAAVVNLVATVFGAAVVLVFSITALSILQRGGRWRGRGSYVGMVLGQLLAASLLAERLAAVVPGVDGAGTSMVHASIDSRIFVPLIGAAIGSLVLVICAALPPRQRDRPGRSRAQRILAGSLRAVAGPLRRNTRMVSLADRLCPPSVEELRARNDRPLLLYLRGFREEEAWFAWGRHGLTFEQFMSRAVDRRLGRLVALGSPMDRIVPAGATRVYCTDEQWRDAVAALMADAHGVLLVPASTANVAWEMSHLVGVGLTDKLCILVPPESLESHRDELATQGADSGATATLRSVGRAVWRTAFNLAGWNRDDIGINQASALAPPLAFAAVSMPTTDQLADGLQAAGLTPVGDELPPGTIVGFRNDTALVVATGLSSPDEYVDAVARHLASSG
jgi:hypothetical protein